MNGTTRPVRRGTLLKPLAAAIVDFDSIAFKTVKIGYRS
jgi:hypothetical protein